VASEPKKLKELRGHVLVSSSGQEIGDPPSGVAPPELPKLRPLDRALLAGASRALPRERWASGSLLAADDPTLTEPGKRQLFASTLSIPGWSLQCHVPLGGANVCSISVSS